MRYDGILTEWNDARGFGWVQADAGGERVFAHISAFQPQPGPHQRPRAGMRLVFSVGVGGGKKAARQVAWQARELRAKAVPRRAARAAPASRSGYWGYGLLLAFAVLCVYLMRAHGLAWQVPVAFALLSLVCWMVYAHDKHQAQTGQWRTPESTLHTLALLGGWPGALLAQQWLRHKSSKTEFQRVFWCTVGLNMAGLLWWTLAGHRRDWLGA